GSSIAHCPKSNAKFGHGYAPLEKMLDAGIAVGLGSDSVASNNICDLLEEGRFASLVARNRADTERLIAAEEILRMATLGGAQALGMGEEIGSLEPGKQADIAIISLSSDAQQPVNEIAACVVFSSSGRDVLSTIVAGEERYRRTA
ncbi:MAG: amidohydrolase family protein, partial [Blastocatellia bacterium]|nr:amidohydrolase family protein [Blastocatellia bacterium]